MPLRPVEVALFVDLRNEDEDEDEKACLSGVVCCCFCFNLSLSKFNPVTLCALADPPSASNESSSMITDELEPVGSLSRKSDMRDDFPPLLSISTCTLFPVASSAPARNFFFLNRSIFLALVEPLPPENLMFTYLISCVGI